MPVCVGNMPSPKGLGFCAHNESLYKVMLGKDNNYWYVSPTINSRKWKLLRIPSVFFKKFNNINKKVNNNIIIRAVYL
jgi:hypothetical protein